MKGQDEFHCFAQPPLGAISHDGAADPARCGESGAHGGSSVGPIQSLDHHRAARTGAALGRGQELGAFRQVFDRDGRGVGQAEPPLAI
jgi:hypothetical protein